MMNKEEAFEDFEKWIKKAFRQSSNFWSGDPFRNRFLPYSFEAELQEKIRELRFRVCDKV